MNVYGFILNNGLNGSDFLGLDTAWQKARVNGPGGALFYPDKQDFKALEAAIEALNGIKDKIDRTCFDVTVNGGVITRKKMKEITTNSHVILFEGHGGSGGHLDFVDTGSLYFSKGVREDEDIIEWAINRDGPPISPAQQLVIDGLTGGERVRSYCCGGDISPETTTNPLHAFSQLTLNLENLAEKTYDCCDSPIIITLTFGEEDVYLP